MVKRSVSEKLAKLREKLDNTDVGGRNEGFWSPEKGNNVIRVLPEVGDMEYFFQEVGQHRLPDGTFVMCPHFTTSGELDCPICQVVSELYKGNDDDKELARQIKVRKSYWMNIITRDNDDDGGNTGNGPYIYTPGVTVFRSLITLINSPDYGDITDEEQGTDIIVSKKGEKLETEYDVQPRRFSSPIHQDEKIMDEFLDKAVDLSYVVLSEDKSEDRELGEGYAIKLLPYDRMIDEYGIGPGLDIDLSKKEQTDAVSAAKSALRSKKHNEEEAFPDKSTDDTGEIGNRLARARDRRARRK